MKIKKLLALVLSLCMVLSLCACSAGEPTTEMPTDATDKGPITPLVYEVTDETGNTIWVMGSIHVGYDYFYPMPDYVYDAYDRATALAVEADMVAFEADLTAQTQALKPMIYSDGTTLSDHISPALYTMAVQIMTEAGYYTSLLDYYNVVLWASLLEALLYEKMDMEDSLGIDMHLLNKAYAENKTVLEIESAAYQYTMLSNFSEPLQLMMLQSAVASWMDLDAARESLDTLVDTWAAGDEAQLAAQFASETDGLTQEELALYNEYNDAMVVNRNIGMADFAENALNEGEEIFIVVGAAHVVGEGGIIDQLAERGYTVTCIGGNPAKN